MPLTPEDVANKQFTSTRLKPGYDETEVDEFLDEVEAELTRLYRENDELRAKLTTAQRSPGEAGRDRGAAAQAPTQPVAPPTRTPAPTPKPATTPAAPAPAARSVSENATGILALAQRTADEHVAEARTQADRIIGEARSRADTLRREADDKHRQMIGSLETERSALETKVEQLRSFEREYRTRLKSYLETQLRDLDARVSDAPATDARPPSGGAQGQKQPQGQADGDGAQPASASFTPGAPVGGGDRPGGAPQQSQG